MDDALCIVSWAGSNTGRRNIGFLSEKIHRGVLIPEVFQREKPDGQIAVYQKHAEEAYMKKALQKVGYRWLIPGKRNTLVYGIVLWLLKRKCYRALYI